MLSRSLDTDNDDDDVIGQDRGGGGVMILRHNTQVIGTQSGSNTCCNVACRSVMKDNKCTKRVKPIINIDI